MDQQAPSDACMRSFPGTKAFSSEDGSKTANIVEKADFAITTESKGKFNMFSMLRDRGWLLGFGSQNNLSIVYIFLF